MTRISKCWEYGLTDKWISDMFEYNRKLIGTIDKKKKDLIIDFSPKTLQNVFDTFYSLLFGFIISLLICLIEILVMFIKYEQAISTLVP